MPKRKDFKKQNQMNDTNKKDTQNELLNTQQVHIEISDSEEPKAVSMNSSIFYIYFCLVDRFWIDYGEVHNQIGFYCMMNYIMSLTLTGSLPRLFQKSEI